MRSGKEGSPTDDQRRQLESTCSEWEGMARATARIDREALSEAVSELYLELSLPRPLEFLHYPSPEAALRDYRAWGARTGRASLCLWNYQLPLFDPSSYWREWSGWPNLELSIRRTPNQLGCYCYGETLPGPGRLLTEAEHRWIWSAASRILKDSDWCEELANRLASNPVMGALADAVDAEDPTSQACPYDYYLLGPLGWLVREVAATEFARSILGCRVNQRLADAEKALLESGGLLFTFQNLVLCIERPIRFDGKEPVFADTRWL